MVDVYRHWETVCPQCNHPINALSQAGGIVEQGQPQPGDLSICVQCRSVLEMTALGGYRAMTPDDLAALTDDERIDLEATQAFLHTYDVWRRDRPSSPQKDTPCPP